MRSLRLSSRFEVVNAAITAVNSHVVRAVAADCAQLEPDLFVVYEGHNEVIGPFGPAGVFAPFFRNSAAVRVATALKRSRIGQLVADLHRRVTAGDRAPAEWGGMQMFLQQQIAHDDPRLAAPRQPARPRRRRARGRRAHSLPSHRLPEATPHHIAPDPISRIT